MWKEREQEVAKKLLPAIELNPPKPLVTQPRASLNLEKVRASAGEGFKRETLHQGHFSRKVKTLVNGNSVLVRPVSAFRQEARSLTEGQRCDYMQLLIKQRSINGWECVGLK